MDVARIMVFLQRSHIPEANVMGCLQVPHMATVVDGVATRALLNLKSKLDLMIVVAGMECISSSLPTTDAEERWGLITSVVPSLLLAFSKALFSYSSQSFAVFAGVHGGGGRGSLNGDIVLASGED